MTARNAFTGRFRRAPLPEPAQGAEPTTPAWVDHGGPLLRRDVAEAAATSLAATFTQFEFRVAPRGLRWIVRRRERARGIWGRP